MKEFLIFESGQYPQGDFSNKEVLKNFVEKLNKEKKIITCFVGHKWYSEKEEDEYSLGEITALRIDGQGRIFATEYEFNKHLNNLIGEKKLRYVSAEITGNPEKEITITGVAFLGRTPPQLTQTLLQFNATTDKRLVGFNKLNKNIFKNRGEKMNDKKLIEELQNNFSKMKEEFDKKFSALETENKTLKEENAKFSQAINEKNKLETEKESREFFLKKQEEGKIPPAFFEKAVSIDNTLVGEAKTNFRSFIEGLDKVMTFGTVLKDDGTDDKKVTTSTSEIINKI